MEKPKIYFLPHYIAPLKYVERLIPYLRDTYDVGFLIIERDSPSRRALLKYCDDRQYEYYVIGKGFRVWGNGMTDDGKIHIPFYTPLKERYEYSKACKKFFETVKPVKLIAVKTWYQHNMVLKEANRKGIETVLLFWTGPLQQIAFRFNGAHTRVYKRTIVGWVKAILKKTYRPILTGVCRVADVLDVSSKESRFSQTQAILRRVGIFDEYEKRMGRVNRYNPRTVSVVGSLDFQIVHELKQRVVSEKPFREALLNGYGLSDRKPKIVVIIYRFYLLPPIEEDRMSIPQHIAHYYDVFKTIREVFSEEEADIILKMHPGERMIYDSYKDLGVKIYHDESRTDELVCLADLYIADPASSVNNMVLASDTPAIFINFSKLQFLNNLMEYFHIKYMTTEKKDFVEKLKQFKEGTLEKQYDNSHIAIRSVENVLRFIG